jgi:hypothetical protein
MILVRQIRRHLLPRQRDTDLHSQTVAQSAIVAREYGRSNSEILDI